MRYNKGKRLSIHHLTAGLIFQTVINTYINPVSEENRLLLYWLFGHGTKISFHSTVLSSLSLFTDKQATKSTVRAIRMWKRDFNIKKLGSNIV